MVRVSTMRIVKSSIIFALMALCVPAFLEAGNRCHHGKGKDCVVKMTFERSGGFAGAAVAVKGEIAFSANGAIVTSEPKYEDVLSDSEARNLKQMMDRLPDKVASTDSPERDQFQYEVVITSSDGHSRGLILHPGTSPEVTQMLEWVKLECERIWTHRISR